MWQSPSPMRVSNRGTFRLEEVNSNDYETDLNSETPQVESEIDDISSSFVQVADTSNTRRNKRIASFYGYGKINFVKESPNKPNKADNFTTVWINLENGIIYWYDDEFQERVKDFGIIKGRPLLLHDSSKDTICINLMTNMGLRNVEFQFQLQEKELWHDMFKYHWDYACQNNAQLSLDDINSVIYYQNNDSDNSFVEHTSKTLIVEIRNPYSNDSTNHYQFEVTSDLDAQFAECMKQPLDTDELHRIQYNLMNSQIIACEAYQKELLKKLSKSSRDITFYQLHNAFHNQKIKELEEFSNKLDSKMTTSAEFNNDNLNYITTLEREVDELKLQLEKSENTNSTEMKVANEKYSDLLIQSRDLKRKLLQYQSINAKNELDPSILAKSVVENRLKEQIEDLINKTKDQELTIKILQENPIYNNISSSEIRELRQQRAKQSSIIHDLQQEIKKYKNELHEFHNLQNLLNLMGYSSIASASAQSPRYFKVSSQPSHLSTPSPLIKSSATLIQSNNLAKEIMNRIRKYEVKNRVINEQLQEVNEMNITLKQRVLMLEKELRVFSGNPSSVFGKLSKSQFDLEFDTMKLQGENNILKDQISHLRNLAIQSKSRVHDMLVALHDVSFQMKNSIINQNGDESMLMPLQELIDYFEATMHMKVDSKSSSSPSSLTQLNHHGSPSTGSSFRMSPKLSVSSVEKTSPSKQMNDSYASKSISEIQEYCKPIVEERLYQNIFSRYLSKSLVSPIHRNGLSNSPVSEAQDEEGFMNRSRFHRFCNEFQLCVNGLTRGNTALKGLIKGEIDIVFDVNARSNVNGNKPHASPARDTFGYGHSTFKSPSSEFNKTPDRLNAGSKAIPSLHLVFQQFIKAIEDIALKTYRKEVDDYMTSLTHSRGLAEEYDALAVKYAVKLLMYHKIIPVAKNLDLIPWELIYFDRIVTNLSLKEKLYLDLRTNMKVIEAWFTYYENMIQYNLLSSTTTVDKLLRFARDFGVFPFLVTEKEIFHICEEIYHWSMSSDALISLLPSSYDFGDRAKLLYYKDENEKKITFYGFVFALLAISSITYHNHKVEDCFQVLVNVMKASSSR